MSEPKRGAVMIGVSKTGNLPKLKAAVGCAKKMGEWAIQQGFTKELVKVITDERAPFALSTSSTRSTRFSWRMGSNRSSCTCRTWRQQCTQRVLVALRGAG